MRRALPFLAIAITLVGLAASAASLADSLAPEPAFCAEGGCAMVRATAWAKPFGIPMPIFGIAFFATMLGLALADSVVTAHARLVARVRHAAAIASGLAGIGLVGIQAFAIGAFCQLCLVADVSAISLGVVVLATTGFTRGGPRAWPTLARTPAMAALVIAALAIAAPLVVLDDTPPAPPAPPTTAALPEVIARERVPGRVTIVDFIDFECPYCRALHGRLEAAIARSRQAGVDVRVVRKMVPLAQHPGALPAAIAWCCAEQQGKGDAMAEALIAAPTAKLTAAGCEQIAADIGCDMARYRRDAAGADIAARIDRDLADARAAGIKSLPTVYVDAQAFVGAAASVDELVAAIAR
ncbi:MAG TPA: thioredoxin domain-containing protein [Kofleriaceae bacterium]|nr:thioredoxin domain-containing protein [Kofleriaceae bacterium]